MYTITDQTHTFATMHVPSRADIMDFVTPMFELGTDAGVDQALIELKAALDRHSYTGDLEEFLGITIR